MYIMNKFKVIKVKTKNREKEKKTINIKIERIVMIE